jgi:hypothetical protein
MPSLSSASREWSYRLNMLMRRERGFVHEFQACVVGRCRGKTQEDKHVSLERL